MCGICGFLGEGVGVAGSTASDTNAANAGVAAALGARGDFSTLKAMCDVMAHRGPDGEGQYIDEGIALGHRRLSLIDLEGGSQPLVRDTAEHSSKVTAANTATYSRGEYVIVFNGEIYNYAHLRCELQAEGWEFKTKSDTEVLLVAYIAWGEAALNKLRGMFAFAIWNATTRELFLARDFFGIKPLYYTRDTHGGQVSFIFASEIKSILEHPAYERELNQEALEQYLCFQFSALDETFFKGIYKLPPATCAKVNAAGKMQMHRYWKPDYTRNSGRTFDETVKEIAATMQESVEYHNVADVEVGSFLSSGIDSSYMAACLAKVNPEIKTFTVGFAEYEGERDEISWAAELAEKLNVANSNHHITEAEYWESLPLVQWHMDEPSADPSAVALYFVDKLAATQVKAVLSGEGADEFFAGYKIYQAPLANKKLSWVPRGVLRGASAVLRRAGIRGANYLERASESVSDWYYTNANGVVFSAAERAQLLKAPVSASRPQDLCAPAYAEVQGEDEVQRMQHVDLYFWLVGDILLKTDKMSMAHSLESRVPFLDKRVFNLAATIPTNMKVNAEQTKRPLRAAAQTSIPKDWAQKEKLGFPVPVVSWLREPKYQEIVKQAFVSPTAEKFFNTEILLDLLDAHAAGKDYSRKIWVIYMFLLWYSIYFEGKSIKK